MLAGKGINRTWHASKYLQSKGRNKVARAGYGSKGFLVSLHALSNFEIQKYCQNEPRF